MSQQLIQANEQAAGAIHAMADAFPSRTAGLLVHKLDALQRSAGERFGWAGPAIVFPGRPATALALLGVMLAGLFWSTLGSLVVMFVGPKLFGYPGTDPSGLPLGLLLAALNAGLTLTAFAYLLHLLRPRPVRDVYGRAGFEDERRHAAAAGLLTAGQRKAEEEA